jgi:hypothetical protein
MAKHVVESPVHLLDLSILNLKLVQINFKNTTPTSRHVTSLHDKDQPINVA